MAKKNRSRFVIDQDDNVNANSTSNFNYTPTIPDGDIWTVQRIVFAAENTLDGLSGFYRVDFGTGANRKLIMKGLLNGGTIDFPMLVDLNGDGNKKIRVTRTNNSSSARQMIALVWVIKKVN